MFFDHSPILVFERVRRTLRGVFMYKDDFERSGCFAVCDRTFIERKKNQAKKQSSVSGRIRTLELTWEAGM